MGVSAKHFAINNSENYRFMGDSVCDMRAAREIYLKVFERIVKEGKPATLMCAYNKINGEYCSQNKWLLTDVLREEWGFDGYVHGVEYVNGFAYYKFIIIAWDVLAAAGVAVLTVFLVKKIRRNLRLVKGE